MSTAQLTRADDRPSDDPARTAARSSWFRPRGLGWLAWRQSRLAVWTFGGVLLLATLALLVVRWRLDAMNHRLHGVCSQQGSYFIKGCPNLFFDASDLLSWFTDVVEPLVFGLPVVVGMFLGAPLLSQEYERGTVRLTRVQSVSPGRWLAARLGVPAVLVVLAVGALSAVTSWIWYADSHRAGIVSDPPFQGLTYPAIGVAPLAWSLYALALGVLIGQLLRRTVAAVLVTGLAVGASQLLFRAVRVHFVPLTDVTVRNAPPGAPFVGPRDSWLVHHGAVLADGTRYTSTECWPHYDACAHATSAWGSYHPLSQLLPMQLIEAALLAVVAAGALWLAFRRVRRSAF
ncbi:hypothetical protein [Streptomyces sp. TLI_171]|uniref:hypothetical protein n=1 Tax=Streptomyces sp. TLI_171 TaxID=1938859 RepID=UPI000C17EF99|nr:hypothetical protein [Streptomyces sp. TLI_171]RKE17507.1 hypothetical protein BX266_0765 [Streptomyces sp. TLI_171]